MHCYARHPGAACPAFHRISSRSYESIEPLFGLPARSGSTFCRKTNGQPGMALVDADSTTGSSLARPSAPPAEPAIHNKAKHETIRVSPAVLGGTSVESGTASAVVVTTGVNTYLGRLPIHSCTLHGHVRHPFLHEPACHGAQVFSHRPASPHYFPRLAAPILKAHTSRDCGLMHIEAAASCVKYFHIPCLLISHGGQDTERKGSPSRAPLKRATVRCAKSVSRVKLMGGLICATQAKQPLTAELPDSIRKLQVFSCAVVSRSAT
jgi:hypothetical protein